MTLSNMAFDKMILSIMAFNKMTLSITAFNKMTPSVMICSIKMLSITIKNATLTMRHGMLNVFC